MDSAVIGGLVAFAGIVVTYILAPKLDAKRRERIAAKEEAAEDRRDEAQSRRDEWTLLFQRQEKDRDDDRQRIAQLEQKLEQTLIRELEKDKRIAVLEVKVERFEQGLAHPLGYVLIPGDLWAHVRARLGDSLPPGPFVGEDLRPPRRDGRGRRDERQQRDAPEEPTVIDG